MSAPQVVVFDLGKVLVDFDYRIAVERLAARCDLPAGELNRLINQSPLLLRYETGLMTTAEFFAAFQAASGYRGDIAEFSRVLPDIFTTIDPMITLHAELRSRGLRTFIFSNTSELAYRHIREHFPFFWLFDGYVLSYEHRCMKPDARLYEVVEQRTGCRNGDVLYLDDRPENVEAGAARGWQVLLHETPTQTRARMRELGLIGG